MPTIPERDEEYEFQKRGRAVSEEQRAKAVEARAARLLSLETGGPSGGRVNVLERSRGAAGAGSARGLPGAARSRESVLKVIGWSKTQHSAKNQAAYTARKNTDSFSSFVLFDIEEVG